MTLQQIHCVIVDDEPQNITLLENMLSVHCNNIAVVATTTNAQEAQAIIKEMNPQLVFLDIEMPHITGFELIKQLEPISFEVIFVTAYSNYAVEAFDHNAIGYITKPINAGKLQAAVQTATERIQQKNITKNLVSILESTQKNTAPQKIPLSTTSGMIFVKIADIMYCESSGNYTNFIVQHEKPILVTRQLGEYEKLLPETDFMRIHDKYIINLSMIKEYLKGNGGDVILENGQSLPVAARRKEEFLARFEKWIKRKGIA
jgi:two-component system, LytTR family, response regulator